MPQQVKTVPLVLQIINEVEIEPGLKLPVGAHHATCKQAGFDEMSEGKVQWTTPHYLIRSAELLM
jgi:hypothetical protein